MNTVIFPRGIRNNNPGNIRRSGAPWQGERDDILDDSEFAVFVSPLYGIRALMKLLLTYQDRHALNTVRAIINRYAPPHENDTDAYISQVARHIGHGADETLDLHAPATLMALTQAIVTHENGRSPPSRPKYWYDGDLYQQAARLLLPSTAFITKGD